LLSEKEVKQSVPESLQRLSNKEMPATKKTTIKKAVKTEEKKKSPDVVDKQLKLRIKLKAYDHKIIDNSAKQIIDIANRFGAEVLGPVPLPTEILKYTVNRSSFVHKNAREQFEMRVHKRIIDILNPNQEIIESLRDLNLPSGVDITVKI